MGEIVGYHGYYGDGEGFLVNNHGDVCTQPPFWDWLLNDHADTSQYKKVAYDLDALVAVILRLGNLAEEDAQLLVKDRELSLSPYKVVYYPSKFFSITKGTGWGKPYFGIFDMSQYQEFPTLDLSPSVEDCIAKAREARDLGAEVSHTLHDLGLDGNVITSPVRSLEKRVLEGMDLPSHLDCPVEVNDLALRNCVGNWVEGYQLGSWLEGGVYDLDIGGAYASVLAQLYDTRRGHWFQSSERPAEALYGFAEGEIEITSPFSPILYSMGDDEDVQRRRNYSPTGIWHGVLNMAQMDFIREYRLGSFEMGGEGWWWIPHGKPPYTNAGYQCLKGVVSWLWEKRKTETPLQKKLLKRAMAGLWGRTLAVRGGEYAPSFYPVWGSYVESITSLKVARLCLDNGVLPLHVAVDGILTNKKLPGVFNDELGNWRISHIGNAIIVSSGMVAVQGKGAEGDFGLRYDWLKDAIEGDPGASEYKMKKVGCYTLAKALNTEYDRLGEVEEITRSVVIGADNKRLYPEWPECGGDLLKNRYPSEPLDVSLLGDRVEIVEA